VQPGPESRDGRHGGLRRIGFVIPEFPTQTHIAWWRISRAMRARVDVQLLSTRRPKDDCPHPLLREAARDTIYLWPPSLADLFDGCLAAGRRLPAVIAYARPLRGFPGRRKARFLALLAAAARLRRICRRQGLDHVFVHSCGDAAYTAALCRILGGPGYSLRLGGDLEVYGTDHPAKMSRATLIVPAAASYEPRLVSEVGLDPDQIMWTWVGTDTTLFRPGAGERAPGPLRVVTVARLNRAKGYQQAVPAIARLAERGVAVEYTIVGEGPFRPDIERLIRDHGVADSVRLLGSRSAEQIAELHAASDVFLLPTSGVGEGTPAAVCEAMSAGLPIIATRVGGLAQMIDEGVHGLLIPPGDVDAIASAIGTMADDPAFRSRAGAAARERAECEFSVDAVAARILDKIGSRLRQADPPPA
jgi:glycosyltransferase involved in cell wall biosynthesis